MRPEFLIRRAYLMKRAIPSRRSFFINRSFCAPPPSPPPTSTQPRTYTPSRLILIMNTLERIVKRILNWTNNAFLGLAILMLTFCIIDELFVGTNKANRERIRLEDLKRPSKPAPTGDPGSVGRLILRVITSEELVNKGLDFTFDTINNPKINEELLKVLLAGLNHPDFLDEVKKLGIELTFDIIKNTEVQGDLLKLVTVNTHLSIDCIPGSRATVRDDRSSQIDDV